MRTPGGCCRGKSVKIQKIRLKLKTDLPHLHPCRSSGSVGHNLLIRNRAGWRYSMMPLAEHLWEGKSAERRPQKREPASPVGLSASRQAWALHHFGDTQLPASRPRFELACAGWGRARSRLYYLSVGLYYAGPLAVSMSANYAVLTQRIIFNL